MNADVQEAKPMSVESPLPVKGSKRIKRRPRLMTPLITKTKQVAASSNSHVDECSQINADAGQGLDFSVGTRVFFEADGFSGSAVIDDLMPDGSVIWVWPNDATGRKMLCFGEAVIVVASNSSGARRAGPPLMDSTKPRKRPRL